MKPSQRKARFAKKYSKDWDRVLEHDGQKRIVGYKGGDTFNSATIRKIHPDMKEFSTYHEDDEDAQPQIIHAINPEVAHHIAGEHWINDNYRLFEHGKHREWVIENGKHKKV